MKTRPQKKICFELKNFATLLILSTHLKGKILDAFHSCCQDILFLLKWLLTPQTSPYECQNRLYVDYYLNYFFCNFDFFDYFHFMYNFNFSDY